MSAELEVTTETVVTVTAKLSSGYADRLSASLGRALSVISHLDQEDRDQLVNTHTVDDLLALKTALLNATAP